MNIKYKRLYVSFFNKNVKILCFAFSGFQIGSFESTLKANNSTFRFFREADSKKSTSGYSILG